MHIVKSFAFGAALIGCVLCFVGCQVPTESVDNLLLVSFEKDVPITYKMVSERKTEFDVTTSDPKKKSRPMVSQDKLELVMVYTPIKVDPFGLSILKVDCKSVKASHTQSSGKSTPKDAMETFLGKSFTLKVTPTGEIADDSDLERVATELGKASFVIGKADMRIKQPDMISDFIAMQQCLWDTSAAISTQADLNIGDTWQSKELVPWPKPAYPPPTRTVTYTLEQIVQDPNVPDQPRKAIIASTYALSETPLEKYIRPYEEGRFQMQGLLGFLRNHKFKYLEGSGKQVFNLDDGLVESDHQEYLMNVDATFMLPLGDSQPVLTVNQKISIERIPAPKR